MTSRNYLTTASNSRLRKAEKSINVAINPVFLPLLDVDKRYVIMRGSAGSGKSFFRAQFYLLKTLKRKGINVLVVRKSETSHRTSTFNEFNKALNRMGLEDYFLVSERDLTITCRLNGNQILFKGVNNSGEREKLKSITGKNGALTDVWVEEATEITKEDFDVIDDRLRGMLPKGMFFQITLSFNPVSEFHWINQHFFLTDDEVLKEMTYHHHSTYLDNKFMDDAQKRRMEIMKRLDPERYRIYGLGEWGDLEGVIMELNKNYFVGDEMGRPFSQNPRDYEDAYIGQDFGFNHPNAIVVIGVRNENLYILREQVDAGSTVEEIINRANREKIPKYLTMYCDSANPDKIKAWRKAGFRARPVVKEKDAIMNRINYMKERQIFVHPSCNHILKEFQQWKWEKDKLDGDSDRPVDINNDAIDAFGYGLEQLRKNTKPVILNKDEIL